MSCEPYLPGKEIEMLKVVNSLESIKAMDSVHYELSPHIDHLAIWVSIAFLIQSQGDIFLFVHGDAHFEIFKSSGRISGLIIGSGQLQAHIGLQELEEVNDYERIEVLEYDLQLYQSTGFPGT